MFEMGGGETTLLALWVLGIGAAVVSSFLGRHRAGLTLMAILVPVLGSVFAIVVAASDLRSRVGRLSEH